MHEDEPLQSLGLSQPVKPPEPTVRIADDLQFQKAEFTLLSILVGIMVGKAMMHGSGGRGGRKLQIVAVLLTYGSITTGYVPSILKGLREKPLKTEASNASNKVASPARVRTEAFVK